MKIIETFQMPLLLTSKGGRYAYYKLCSSHFGVNHDGLSDTSLPCDDTTHCYFTSFL